tara:strand:+ start:600 stop:1034 length:435 start_codon:yes stop_codon:yes gene_type:complete
MKRIIIIIGLLAFTSCTKDETLPQPTQIINQGITSKTFKISCFNPINNTHTITTNGVLVVDSLNFLYRVTLDEGEYIRIKCNTVSFPLDYDVFMLDERLMVFDNGNDVDLNDWSIYAVDVLSLDTTIVNNYESSYLTLGAENFK